MFVSVLSVHCVPFLSAALHRVSSDRYRWEVIPVLFLFSNQDYKDCTTSAPIVQLQHLISPVKQLHLTEVHYI